MSAGCERCSHQASGIRAETLQYAYRGLLSRPAAIACRDGLDPLSADWPPAEPGRPRLLALGLGSDADAEIFRAICARPLRDELMAALAERDAARADALLAPVLPAALSFSALEIIHGMD